MFTPSPFVHVFTVGEQAALFDARAGRLHELNETAHAIWRALAEGRPAAKALEDMGAGAAEAQQYANDAAALWVDAGYLVPAETGRVLAGPPAAEATLHIAGFALALRLYDEAAARAVEAGFGSLYGEGADGAPVLAVAPSDYGYLIFIDGQPLGAADEDSLVARLKALITERYVASVEKGFLAHGALVDLSGRRLFLTGEPGAGKSTLTAALVLAGGRCLSDDIVHIDEAGLATGSPFPVTLKSGAWPLLDGYSEALSALPIHLRDDGQEVRYLPVTTAAGAGPIDVFISLDRGEAGAARLEAMTALAALCEILASGFAKSGAIEPPVLKALAARIGAARCARLVYSDLGDAVRLLKDAADGAA